MEPVDLLCSHNARPPKDEEGEEQQEADGPRPG
jgi:hypothetical protein